MKSLTLVRSLFAALVLLASAGPGRASEIIHQFTGGATLPETELTEGPDGLLYGITAGDSIAQGPWLYRLTAEGKIETVQKLTDPYGSPINSSSPLTLTRDYDGNLWGTYETYYGGGGGVFRFSGPGQLSLFGMPYGYRINSSRLILGPGGQLYGAAGSSIYGGNLLFSVAPSGKITTGSAVNLPSSATLLGSAGGDLIAVTRNSTWGTDFYRITPSGSYGNYSAQMFVQAPSNLGLATCMTTIGDGTIYAISPDGGSHSQGAFFRITTTNKAELVAEFYEQYFDPTAGNSAYPKPTLVYADDGKFYGLTASYSKPSLYRVSTAGVIELLGTASDVKAPIALTGNASGIYAVSKNGGEFDLGSISRIDDDLVLTTVASFEPFGYSPVGPLVADANGTLYGITRYSGGTSSQPLIYKVTADGAYSRLALIPKELGELPITGLTFGADGALYGSTTYNGASVFRVTLDGEVSSAGSLAPVSAPYPIDVSALLLASDGCLYGTRSVTYPQTKHDVFKIGTDGKLSDLVEFNSSIVTGAPEGGLVEGPDHALYGVTNNYSWYTFGSIYKVSTAGTLEAVAPLPGPPVGYQDPGNYSLGLGPDGALYVVSSHSTVYRWPFTGQPVYAGSVEGGAVRPVFVGGRMYTGSHYIIVCSMPSFGWNYLRNGAYHSGGASPLILSGSYLYGIDYTGLGSVYRDTPTPNSAPVPKDDSFSVTRPVTSVPVLANDTDSDKDALTITNVTTPGQGTVRINADGTLTYTPGPEFSGTDQFTYTLDDGHGGTGSALVEIFNTTPTLATADLHTRTKAVSYDLLESVSDPDQDQVHTVTALGTPEKGTVKLEGSIITYTPGQNYTGLDKFSYTIDDGCGGVTTGLVRVLDVPHIVAGSFSGKAFDSAEDWEDGDYSWTSVRATISASGAFTMNTIWGGAIRGAFNAAGRYHGTVKILEERYVVDLQLNPDTLEITGSMTNKWGDEYTISAGRQSYDAKHPAPQAGQYTFALEGGTVDLWGKMPRLAFGNGYGRMVITSTGHVQMSGRIGDGAALGAGAMMYGRGSCTFKTATQYSGGYDPGTVTGEFTFANERDSDATGHLRYDRMIYKFPDLLSVDTPNYYGFQEITISRYSTARPPIVLAGDGLASLYFGGGSLNGKVVHLLRKGENAFNRAAADEWPATLRLDPKTGLFTGSVKARNGVHTVAGAILQKQDRGGGQYSLPNGCGAIYLGPAGFAPK